MQRNFATDPEAASAPRVQNYYVDVAPLYSFVLLSQPESWSCGGTCANLIHNLGGSNGQFRSRVTHTGQINNHVTCNRSSMNVEKL